MSDDSQSSPVKAGDVLAGKYRVERVLGRGGMGVVVAATHMTLDQKVALKFLLPEALKHPEVVERFAREAKAIAKIRSQHVVRVIDTGVMPDETPYIVMEYLEGKDLSEISEEIGQLPSDRAVDYVLQACEAIAEAHAAGIVHRDLKPANLFLARQPDKRSIVKVLDFGISKVVDPQSAALTSTSALMGSPHYMSPEQLTSTKYVDPRSDIWAIGVILYELLTATKPYDAQTMPEIVARILSNEPEPMATFREDIPAGLTQAVMQCLETKAVHRFATVADLTMALAPFASDRAVADASVARVSRILGSDRPQAASASMVAAEAVRREEMVTGPLDRATVSREVPAISTRGESGRQNEHPATERLSNAEMLAATPVDLRGNAGAGTGAGTGAGAATPIQTQMTGTLGPAASPSTPAKRSFMVPAIALVAVVAGVGGTLLLNRGPATPVATGTGVATSEPSASSPSTASASAATLAIAPHNPDAPTLDAAALPSIVPATATPTATPTLTAAGTSTNPTTAPLDKHTTTKPTTTGTASPTTSATASKNALDMGIK